MSIVFGVTRGQDTGEIVLDVEPILGRDASDVDADDAT